MSITILRTLAGVNGLRDLLSEPLMPRDKRLTSRGEVLFIKPSKVWNLKYVKGMLLKMYGVHSLLLSRSTEEPNFIYK